MQRSIDDQSICSEANSNFSHQSNNSLKVNKHIKKSKKEKKQENI
jgi:hypothetical protein